MAEPFFREIDHTVNCPDYNFVADGFVVHNCGVRTGRDQAFLAIDRVEEIDAPDITPTKDAADVVNVVD